MLKVLFFITFLFEVCQLRAATCTNTTRNNYATGEVLTSTALNADFNQLVTKANAMDAGCLTGGTLELDAMNTTQYSAMLNGVKSGCTLAPSTAAIISVGKCIITVNGFNIKTTTATTATWGASGGSSEFASTQYYVYVASGSTATTLNLYFNTDAPGVDGYKGNDRAIGTFYNNASSDIASPSIASFDGNSFKKTDSFTIPTRKRFGFSFGTTDGVNVCSATPCSYLEQWGDAEVSSVTRSATGTYTANFANAYTSAKCVGNTTDILKFNGYVTGTGFSFTTFNTSFAAADAYGTFICEGY